MEFSSNKHTIQENAMQQFIAKVGQCTEGAQRGSRTSVLSYKLRK